MLPPILVPEIIDATAAAAPGAVALEHDTTSMSYAELAQAIHRFANGALALGLGRGERVAIYLEKRFESVVAMFGAMAAGGVAVPVNPALKPAQVAHILRDCTVRVLVTSEQRLGALLPELTACAGLDAVITLGPAAKAQTAATSRPRMHAWERLLDAPQAAAHRLIDSDMAAIFYTSGSTGKPKGVVVSHRNLVAGARSVAGYLENNRNDALLAALPLSFDAGFSQLTTAFQAGARVALLNYLLPQDVVQAIDRHRITGLTAVPPLYIQLARMEWPAGALASLRYFANTGGHMPREVLAVLRQRLPGARPYLMYGLTEAFRSTYLHPDQVERRPDSIGRAIPNAEVLVLRPDGTRCAPDEPGELVHRGPLVAQGYWNDPAATAARFRPLPVGALGLPDGLTLPEIAVFSGDTVRADAEGFLYFVGRGDGMIKTSGYRVSPTEIEEVLYASGLVAECAVFGLPDEVRGQTIAAVVVPHPGVALAADRVTDYCRQALPAYMLPSRVLIQDAPLPRNANGKIDRAAIVAAGAAPRS
mgnify:CR=1 FL=1